MNDCNTTTQLINRNDYLFDYLFDYDYLIIYLFCQTVVNMKLNFWSEELITVYFEKNI